ncbi:hypothetical protein GCM10023336_34700 [Streptomyces similanensis]|uniref:Uncharacterized protein n=1 Tax=Streptomyces similanensis TaxID=1274988 RepID=A0ABP9KHQ8_9ACTN
MRNHSTAGGIARVRERVPGGAGGAVRTRDEDEPSWTGGRGGRRRTTTRTARTTRTVRTMRAVCAMRADCVRGTVWQGTR